MADLNPMVPGDVPYPQYSVTTTEQIRVSTQITKGVVYTKDTAGTLNLVSTTLENGIYQAKATLPLPSVTNDKVQVLSPRSRMIFIDTVGGLVPGEDVIVVANTTNIVTGSNTSPLYIGKVFEIYTRDTDGTKKKVSEAGDKVVVETIQA